MKVELKSVKHSPELSEETAAFAAKVYVDGRLVGKAHNAGRGGGTEVDVIWKGERDPKNNWPVYDKEDKKAVAKLHKWAAKNHKYGLEGVIDDLLYDELHWKEFQKLKRKHLLYTEGKSVWSIDREGVSQAQIKSGDVERVLKNTDWWKDEYVLLNNVTKTTFVSKYLDAFKNVAD